MSGPGAAFTGRSFPTFTGTCPACRHSSRVHGSARRKTPHSGRKSTTNSTRPSAKPQCANPPTCGKGNSYVPIFMANAGEELPQRRPVDFLPRGLSGADLAQDDPLVASTLAMLQATECEGMVYGTGWNATGIWNYFASFYGHAWSGRATVARWCKFFTRTQTTLRRPWYGARNSRCGARSSRKSAILPTTGPKASSSGSLSICWCSIAWQPVPIPPQEGWPPSWRGRDATPTRRDLLIA